ncbi:hypothetical protein GQ55_9G395100 [Panicum hallii var. hallii]|uniref:Transmembrane protein n=1 Tax=Panicum hallii var. hallii TaxID=1504633 RepID=A0A2T7C9R9_9POAL|nr:hypothetical protein GQ55_9G395100 [Panicum hallii var. hallii]
MMLGVNHHHQVWRAVRRSRSPLITDSANSSSRTTDDEADADEASWTTDDEAGVSGRHSRRKRRHPRRPETGRNPCREADVVRRASELHGQTPLVPPGAVPRARAVPAVAPNRPARVSFFDDLPPHVLVPLLLHRIPVGDHGRVHNLFVYVSHLPLLALAATRLLSALAGMTVLYLNTICAAGLCGVAIAERRRRSWSEKSAKAVRINDKSDPAFPAMVASLMSLVCAARVLWMCFSFGPEDAVSAIFELSFMAIVSLFSWTLFVDGCLLHGALFSGHTLGMLGVAAMATAGLLGYTLTVDQQYKQLQRASH